MNTSPARIESALQHYRTQVSRTGKSTGLEMRLFEALDALWRGDVRADSTVDSDRLNQEQYVILDINVYDNEVYPGTGQGGASVAAYDVVYGVEPNRDANPVIHILIPNWYPPGWDDDHWCEPSELPRRIRRQLIKAGAVFS